jgi:hypothetical protein
MLRTEFCFDARTGERDLVQMLHAFLAGVRCLGSSDAFRHVVREGNVQLVRFLRDC